MISTSRLELIANLLHSSTPLRGDSDIKSIKGRFYEYFVVPNSDTTSLLVAVNNDEGSGLAQMAYREVSNRELADRGFNKSQKKMGRDLFFENLLGKVSKSIMHPDYENETRLSFREGKVGDRQYPAELSENVDRIIFAPALESYTGLKITANPRLFYRVENESAIFEMLGQKIYQGLLEVSYDSSASAFLIDHVNTPFRVISKIDQSEDVPVHSVARGSNLFEARLLLEDENRLSEAYKGGAIFACTAESSGIMDFLKSCSLKKKGFNNPYQTYWKDHEFSADNMREDFSLSTDMALGFLDAEGAERFYSEAPINFNEVAFRNIYDLISAEGKSLTYWTMLHNYGLNLGMQNFPHGSIEEEIEAKIVVGVVKAKALVEHGIYIDGIPPSSTLIQLEGVAKIAGAEFEPVMSKAIEIMKTKYLPHESDDYFKAPEDIDPDAGLTLDSLSNFLSANRDAPYMSPEIAVKRIYASSDDVRDTIVKITGDGKSIRVRYNALTTLLEMMKHPEGISAEEIYRSSGISGAGIGQIANGVHGLYHLGILVQMDDSVLPVSRQGGLIFPNIEEIDFNGIKFAVDEAKLESFSIRYDTGIHQSVIERYTPK